MICFVVFFETQKEVLRQIAQRERDNLTVCLKELEKNQGEYTMFYRGYNAGKTEIEKYFERE